MNKNTLTLREKVIAVLEDKTLTDYRIGKELDIYVNSVAHLRKGKGDIGNIRLEMAEKYAAYYDRLHAEQAAE